MANKRDVELVVISDIHLGTYGCQAEELLKYLKSIRPAKLVLNGDIIDIWQFSKHYWPKSHMLIIKHIISLLAKGTTIYYIPGNHDEMLRKFVGFKLGNLSIVNKVVLRLNGKKAWFFHGDVFDVTMKNSKWIARLGAIGYDSLIIFNTFINFLLKMSGREKISLSKKIKDSVKKAVKFINDFEETAAEIAIENKYDYVICGHIHQPQMRKVVRDNGEVYYLNSGDWIENLTALEYNKGDWRIYHYNGDADAQKIKIKRSRRDELDNGEIFKDLINEFLNVHTKG